MYKGGNSIQGFSSHSLTLIDVLIILLQYVEKFSKCLAVSYGEGELT